MEEYRNYFVIFLLPLLTTRNRTGGKILEKMAGTANLLFEEAGKSYEPMFLKSVKILPDKLFEMEVRNIYGNRKIINVEIEKLSLMKYLSCIIDT